MFGLGGDDPDKQRMWNAALFKLPLSDDEIKNLDFGDNLIFMFFLVAVLAILIGLAFYCQE